jgi:hypothetical protein
MSRKSSKSRKSSESKSSINRFLVLSDEDNSDRDEDDRNGRNDRNNEEFFLKLIERYHTKCNVNGSINKPKHKCKEHLSEDDSCFINPYEFWNTFNLSCYTCNNPVVKVQKLTKADCSIREIEKLLILHNVIYNRRILGNIYESYSCLDYSMDSEDVSKYSIFNFYIFMNIDLQKNFHLFSNKEIFELFFDICYDNYTNTEDNIQIQHKGHIWFNNNILKTYFDVILRYVQLHNDTKITKIFFTIYLNFHVSNEKDLSVFLTTNETYQMLLEYLESRDDLYEIYSEYIQGKRINYRC